MDAQPPARSQPREQQRGRGTSSPQRRSASRCAGDAATAPGVPEQQALRRRISDVTCCTRSSGETSGGLSEEDVPAPCGAASAAGGEDSCEEDADFDAPHARPVCTPAEAAAARGAALALLTPLALVRGGGGSGGSIGSASGASGGTSMLRGPSLTAARVSRPLIRVVADADDSADESPTLRRSFSCSTVDRDALFAPSSATAAAPLLCGGGRAPGRSISLLSPMLPQQPQAGAPPVRAASFSCLSSCSAVDAAADDAVELCCRLSRARQTVDFVHRQRRAHCTLTKARLSLWDALLLLDDVPPVAAALCAGAPGAPPVRHLAASLAAASAALHAHPDAPWLAFVALTHALGRLLLLPRFGGEPAWSVVGETFPVGCRFDPSVSYAACFGANPDRRKRAYASPTGVYAPGCGLAEVDMCWSCDEYLLEVLARNRAALPPAGLFCVRYASFASLGGAAVGYNALLTSAERDAMPWLHALRRVKRDAAAASDEALGPHPDARAALRAMEHIYRPLIDQFCPGELCW
jgi:inositol oxygenase